MAQQFKNCENRYLISTEKDLGKLEQIRIWHDNSAHSPSWYCRKVMIRNIKTGHLFVFFVDRWLTVDQDKSSLIYTVDKASDLEVQHYFSNTFSLLRFWHCLRKSHIWITPFTCSPRSPYIRAERLTTLCFVLSIYMLLLNLIYGLPDAKSVGITAEFGNFTWEWSILGYGCLVSICGLVAGHAAVYVFTHLQRNLDRIPALIIWQPKEQGVLVQCESKEKQSNFSDILHAQVREQPEEFSSSCHAENAINYDHDRTTDPNPEVGGFKLQRIASVPKLEYSQEKEGSLSLVKRDFTNLNPAVLPKSDYETSTPSRATRDSEVFRIPSTDILDLEKWIGNTYGNIARNGSPGSNAFIRFVDDPPQKQVDPECQKLNEMGYKNITEIAGPSPWKVLRKENTLRKLKTTKSSGNQQAENTSTLQNDDLTNRSVVRGKPPQHNLPRLSTSSEQLTRQSLKVDVSKQDSAEYLREAASELSSTTSFSVLQGGENRNGSEHINEESKTVHLNVQLGEIDNVYQHRGFYFTANKRVAIWWVCVSTILAGNYCSINYGVRYSFNNSLRWTSSLACAIISSFLIIQPLKVLWEYRGVINGIERKKRLGELDRFCYTKFKVLLLKEGDETQKIWPLSYLHYIPQTEIEPLTGAKIFEEKLHSRRVSKLRKGLADIIAYLVILIIVIYNVTISTDRLFHETYKTLAKSLKLTPEQHGINSFREISSTTQFYDYLEETFIPSIQWERDLGNDEIIPDPESSTRLRNRDMILLGVPRLRQVRIQPGTGMCHHIGPFSWFQHSCDEEYNESTKESRNFIEGWGIVKLKFNSTNDIWKHGTVDELGYNKISGYFGTYYGDGYVAELGRVQNQSLSVIDHAKRTGWIDTYTRAIFIEFLAYNPNINVYASGCLAVEISPSRKFMVTPIVHVTRFWTSRKAEKSVETQLESTALLTSVAYLFISSIIPIHKVYTIEGKLFLQLWRLLWSNNFLVATAAMSLQLYEFIVVANLEESFDEIKKAPSNKYISILDQEVKHRNRIYFYLSVLILCSTKFWTLISLSNRRFLIIGLTFRLIGPFVLGILLITVAWLICFGMVTSILLGPYIFEYSSFGTSFVFFIYQVGLRTVFPYGEMSRYSPVFGRLIFFIFNVGVIFVYINIVMSVLMMGLQEAKEVAMQRSFEFSYVNLLWLQMQLILPTKLCNYLNKRFSRRKLTEELETEFEYIAVQVLGNHLASIETQRMEEIRQECKTFMNDTGQGLYSRKDKEKIKKKRLLKFEESRLNGMRETVLKFMKEKLKTDFRADELKTYNEFNRKILKTRYQKIEQKLQEIKEILEKDQTLLKRPRRKIKKEELANDDISHKN